jgi:hypothetical protein
VSPLQYLQKVGRAEADATARRAKLSPGYFNQICYGHRHASYAAAEKLVQHQNRRGKMTILSILSFKRKKGAQVGVRVRSKRQLTSHAQ